MLLIAGTTGSFALAGTATALVVLAGVVSGPLRGRALDRFGSRFVIPRVAVIRAGALAAIWPAAVAQAPWAIVGLAAIAGFAAPAAPTAMRLQWRQLLGPGDSQLGHASAPSA